MNIQWSHNEQRWYLGVRCRKCHSPILFAVDHSGGGPGQQAPPAGMLVLTCTIADCKHKADYTGAVILSLQKPPAEINKTIETMTSGKSRNRKG